MGLLILRNRAWAAVSIIAAEITANVCLTVPGKMKKNYTYFVIERMIKTNDGSVGRTLKANDGYCQSNGQRDRVSRWVGTILPRGTLRVRV